MQPSRLLRSVRLSACLLTFGALAEPAGAATVVVTPHPKDPLASGIYLRSRLASITNASEYRRYLLKLEAGVYDLKDATLTMKPYVDVEGSGQGVTVVRSRAISVGTIQGAPHSELRELTVANSGPIEAVALVNSFFPFSATRVTSRLPPFRNGREIPGNSVLLWAPGYPVGPTVPDIGSDEHVRLVTVVRAKPELDVGDRRVTADGAGHDVVVLEEGALAAATAADDDER